MANKASSKKRVRQNQTRRARNRARRSALRTQIKKVRQTVAGGEAEQVPELLVQTQRSLDKAVSQGLVHRNKAARLKSRLAAVASAAARSA